MNFKFLLESELRTADYSAKYLRGFDYMISKIVDTFLQLSYFCGTYKKAMGVKSTFNSYCFYQYLQLPYGLRAAFILYQFGYYLESTFILRYLMEISAKMKYLRKHKHFIQDMWINKSIYLNTRKGKKRRLSLKDIFEEVSPGSYSNYGRLLSGFHHGGVGTVMFRTIRDATSIKEIKMGSNWDEKTATFVVNNIIMLSYVFLNNFPTFFPRGFRRIDKDVLKQYSEVIVWLSKALKDHKKTHPRSRKWYRELAGLLRKG